MQVKLKISIVTSLLLLFSICKGQTTKAIYPTEKFSVIEAKLADGKPVIGSVNLAYKTYDKKKEYRWCLTLNIALELKNVTGNGLPSKAESDVANKFEDELLKHLKAVTITHYIGHLYNDGFLDVYVYLEHPEKANQYLQSQTNNDKITRPIAFKIEEDPTWNNVKFLLK